MPKRNAHESGFALILSLLALVLLTTMGLALANSTGVELQISTNHRWSESAKFNAEAGVEFGKSILMALPSWDAILPVARASQAWDGAAATDPNAVAPFAASRNFENWQCDDRGYGMGYGVVLNDGTAGGLHEYRSQVGGATLNGAFTLWVRRPVMWNATNQLEDYTDDTVLILVSEGVAPYTDAAKNTSAFGASNRAVYTIETLLSRAGTVTVDQSECNSRQGQAGGSASGGNTAGCISLTAGRQVKEALGTAGTGSGDLK